MSSRQPPFTILGSSASDTDPVVPSINDPSLLNGDEATRTLDSNLSQRRENAANFKRFAPSEPCSFRRVIIDEQASSSRDDIVTKQLRRAIELRDKWVYRRSVPEWHNYRRPRHSDYTVFVPPPYHPFEEPLMSSSDHVCQWQDGVVHVFTNRSSVMRRKPDFVSPNLQEYAKDLVELMNIVNDPDCRSFSYRRLVLLQERFNMYITLNEDQERMAQIRVPHRDFYNVRKVDTHGKPEHLHAIPLFFCIKYTQSILHYSFLV